MVFKKKINGMFFVKDTAVLMKTFTVYGKNSLFVIKVL